MNSLQKFPLSVVILARNEEQNIARCVQAVQWCDDVVVVDDGSTDRTCELAKAAGARVVQHAFENFAAQRNWAMQSTLLKHEWVLHLDADEVVTSDLKDALSKAIQQAAQEVVAFRMCRKTMLGEAWLRYSDGFPVWIMRLVRCNRAGFVSSGHGEVPVPPVEGQVGTIREPFLHYAFSKGWSDWLDRHNRYSSREAALEMLDEKSSLNWRHLLTFDKAQRRKVLRALSRKIPFRPWFRFVYQYILKAGILDGRPGWTFCCLMAEYERWIVLKRQELEARTTESVRRSDPN